MLYTICEWVEWLRICVNFEDFTGSISAGDRVAHIDPL